MNEAGVTALQSALSLFVPEYPMLGIRPPIGQSAHHAQRNLRGLEPVGEVTC